MKWWQRSCGDLFRSVFRMAAFWHGQLDWQHFCQGSIAMSLMRLNSSFTIIAVVTIATILGLSISSAPKVYSPLSTGERQAKEPSHILRARRILRDTPLVDGHNDFPILVRQQLHNQIYPYRLDELALGSQTDFKKMEKGMMGGQFWSVFMPCPESPSSIPEKEHLQQFNKPNVRAFETQQTSG